MEEHAVPTQQWLYKCPRHVAAAYQPGQQTTQILVATWLLQTLQYPDAAVLSHELLNGFPILGQLLPGTGWPLRCDDNYSAPTYLAELETINWEYTSRKLAQNRVSEHWQTMLQEILKDYDLRRMNGPFATPADWTTQTVSVSHNGQHLPLQPCPQSKPLVSFAFPILQIGSDDKDKIRRGEDWRRGGQNRPVQVNDAPLHHTVDDYVQLARTIRDRWRTTPQHWGHDHEGAYRQLPLDQPDNSYVVLLTPDGPTLWNHNVLMFGAVASVWAYNRFGDFLITMARSLLAIPALHYVDDYGAVEPPHSAASGFETFLHFKKTLGFDMKRSKEQPPAFMQKTLGVSLSFMDDCITVAPTAARVQKMTSAIQQCLHTDLLSSHDAETMAGKLVFLSTTMFGRMGRAATKPIYGRQYFTVRNRKLTHALRDALTAWLHVLSTSPPRAVPWHLPDGHCNFLYADAFFDLGDKRYRPSDEDIPTEWQPRSAKDLHNGWGVVFFPRRTGWRQAVTLRGTVPCTVLQKFCQRQAFIYFLEAWAQILPSIALAEWLDGTYMAFVDNEAAKRALIKGYGNDIRINAMLGMYWAFHADHQRSPWLERVSSAANLSDAISRDDFSLNLANGWLHLRLDLADTYAILIQAANDMQFAVQQASALIADSLQPQVRTALHKAGVDLTASQDYGTPRGLSTHS